jgi:peptidoglycan hydrolase-like protein with peptidoglycan-binding domain
MRQLMSAAMVLLVSASGITGITLAAAGPASAQASCTSGEQFVNQGGHFVDIPTTASGSDNCDLGVGNQSLAVQLLQYDLNRCYGQHLTVDGIYGPLTKAAVEVAQRASGATVDGIYGPQTRDHIKWVDAYTGAPSSCFRL